MAYEDQIKIERVALLENQLEEYKKLMQAVEQEIGTDQTLFSYLSHWPSMVGLWPLSSMAIGCVVPTIELFSAMLAQDELTGNWTRNMERTSSEISLFSHWAIMTQDHVGDRQRDTFILPLSYHDPGPQIGQTVRYIHSPAELSWPGPWIGQTVRGYIHSPAEISPTTGSFSEVPMPHFTCFFTTQ